jgi:hypothetical protein
MNGVSTHNASRVKIRGNKARTERMVYKTDYGEIADLGI